MIYKISPWHAVVLTIFPKMFPGPLSFSLAGQGLKNNTWKLHPVNIRDFAQDKHRSVDSTSFGGGAGMVMRPDVVDAAIDATRTRFSSLPLLFLTPRGKKITQCKIQELAKGPGVQILCGRFEGIDQRVLDLNQVEEFSLADFVMSGGESAAITILDACIRLLPGIVGKAESLTEESFQNGLLEHPHYTRPQNWRGLEVPKILLSGNHKRINQWRLDQSESITERRRPDLWSQYIRKHAGNASKSYE